MPQNNQYGQAMLILQAFKYATVNIMNIRLIYKKIIRKLAQEIKKYYKARLISLVFFGSAARETPHPFSDIDFLIVAEGLPNGRMPRVLEFEAIEKKISPFLEQKWEGLQGNVPLSPIFKTPNEVKQGSLLFLDFLTDAKIAYDRKNFFKNFLQAFEKKLKILGSKKIISGGSWHWVLKPDLNFGETIDLSV